jgi:eukaryotic-like serine/threonine-protein kinase
MGWIFRPVLLEAFMADASNDKTLSSVSIQASFTSIGPYRLIEMVGVGGMGEVWRAEQTEPFHRTVALKLIKAGMDTRAVVTRFESERQALALMEHPNIAKVFDAGATPEGRPFFVMEYVPGLPITAYCDRHRLKIKQRLALFIQVCEGVQHAHQKAIIHRDLKPSNVLVGEVDGKPVPKIIDFGLAKATGPRLSEATLYTEVGGIVGTPDYMSPEQADRTERNIDTRSDVYSLGVILYELLVGALPFSPRELRGDGLPAMLEKIRAEEPTAPSTKLKSSGESSKETAAQRGEEPQTLLRHLRGELDWITLKALEKDRSRRYGTPMELAADIGRYLNNEPIVARPASTGYRIRKYVRRHSIGVTVAAGLVLLLTGFAVTQAVQVRHITAERDRTARERDRANRITDFMMQIFKVSNPSEARGNSVTARELLDKAAKEIDTGLAKDPEVQAQMEQTMGNVYDSLGLYARAENLDRNALATRTRLLGAGHPDTIDSMSELAVVLDQQTKLNEAEKLAHDSFDLARKEFGPSATVTVRSATQLGRVLNEEGRYPEAEAVLTQALNDVGKNNARKNDVGNDESTQDKVSAGLEANLGVSYAYQGKYVEAEKTFRQAYEINRKLYGEDDPQTLTAENSIGSSLLRQDRYSEGESIYRDVIERENRVLGPEHPTTLLTKGNLALSLMLQTRYAEAEPLLREVWEAKLRVLGPDNRSTLVVQGQLADVLHLQNRLPEAEKLARQTLDTERRVMGPEHSDTLVTMGMVARILAAEHNYSEAESLFRDQLELLTHALGPDHPDTLDAAGELALLRVREHHDSEGEAALRDLLAKRVKLFTIHSPKTAAGEYNMAAALALEGKRDEAISHLKSFLEDGPALETQQGMSSDPDLNSLHTDPRFTTLVERAKRLSGSGQ